jgi:HEPN domain-containing protein
MNTPSACDILLKKADADLKVALDELNTIDPALEIVCFHFQQFIEKYLKAFLISNQIKPDRTHSLVSLFHTCSEVNEVFKEFLTNDLIFDLEDCSVEARYDTVDFITPEFTGLVKALTFRIKEIILELIK